MASGRIGATAAYLGAHATACHAAAGLTARTRWLYGEAGTAYVYFIYGVHWCMNAVTRAVGSPSAVLIRALEPLDGLKQMRERRGEVRDRDLTNGPGKLFGALGCTGSLNGFPPRNSATQILRGEPVAESRGPWPPAIATPQWAAWRRARPAWCPGRD